MPKQRMSRTGARQTRLPVHLAVEKAPAVHVTVVANGV